MKRNIKSQIKATILIQMILGNILIGVGVGCYRLSGFGVDAYTCMNLGISGFLGMTFGTWQLIMNGAILILVFLCSRKLIGYGTLVNMIFVGYISDFICWILLNVAGISVPFFTRILFLILGTLFAAIGCALYINADLGVSPYDAVGIIINKISRDKISFRTARVCSDITVILVGIAFCIASKNRIWTIVGIGTITNAFFMGPLIAFFQRFAPKASSTR